MTNKMLRKSFKLCVDPGFQNQGKVFASRSYAFKHNFSNRVNVEIYLTEDL